MELTKKQIQTRKKYSKKRMTSKKVLIFIIVLLVFFLLTLYSEGYAKGKNSTNDITTMVIPTQNMLPCHISFCKEINGVDVRFTQIAEYQISGKVVEEYDYTSGIAGLIGMINNSSMYNSIAVKDVAIAYGPMALSENHSKMEYIMSGSRRILYAVKDKSVLETVGDIDTVKSYITNNHLIASSENVEKLINKINKGEYVQISGYLVNVSWKSGMYEYNLNSSTQRDDVGSNACEIIYVEDVKWIK